MELVTLAHVTFYRIGSASRAGMVRHNDVHSVGEVRDNSPQTLREFVLSRAEKQGEPPESLLSMRQVSSTQYSPQLNALIFDIPRADIQYGTPYAACYAYPALKIGDRYFKLDEVEP